MARRGAIVVVGLVAIGLVLALVGPLVMISRSSAQVLPLTVAPAVAAPFQTAWEADGGLERFGAPVTAALTAHDMTAQYFERAKLTLGTDGVVRPAALGRDLYERRYPATIFTPLPIDPASLPGGVGATDAATGIAVPAIFAATWQRFGGAGSLGAPVSPAFREGADIVQYFEASRLSVRSDAANSAGTVAIGPLGQVAYGSAYAAPRPPTISTSLSIFGDLISNVAGDTATVTPIIGAGVEPHDFEPSPTDAAAIASSHVLFVNGQGLEAWLDHLIQNAGAPDLRIVMLSAGLPALGQDPHGPESGGGNPHLWLDPTLAMAYVMTIRDTLSELDPANGPTYDANAARYLAQLRDLDTAIGLEVASVAPERRTFVTFHDAWPYFTARYGFKNIPVHQANPEAELTAQEYAALIDLIRREQVTVIFGEAGFNPKMLQQLARDTGVRFVDNLYGDTLAPSGPAATYLGMMQHDVSRMVDALA